MNRARLATALAALVSLGSAHATQAGPGRAIGDRGAIVRTALDFEESWYEGDAARMARVLHPAFIMRHVRTDPHSGKSVLDQSWTAQELIAFTRAGRGKVPPRRRRHDITVLGVFNNAATAQIVAWYGVDFLQLAKWNGRWVVVSVLWGKNPS